jgi:peroxiredoxin
MRAGPWLSALLLLAAATSAPAVEIGDEAPDIDVTSWIQGEPVVLKDCVGKKVVVVAFWRTDSDPSKKAVPTLSRLAERHKDHGVEVVAISDEKPEVIKEFAADGKFKCRVACDGERNTSGPYTKGFKFKSLPVAVVVDKTGVVVWKGAPGLVDRMVDKVLAGKYDAEMAKKIAEQEGLMDDATTEGVLDKAGAEAEKLLEMDAGNEKAIDTKFKQFQKNKDAAKLKTWVESLLPTIDGDANALNRTAWTLITMENLALRQPAAALKAARRAVEASGGIDPHPIDTLARVQYSLGLIDEAIATQKKAVALDSTDEELKGALSYYEACAEARKAAPAK